MIIIRLIILAALIGAVVFIYRKFIAANKSAPPPPADVPAMKKCSHCGVHLPTSDAIESGGQYFCSQDHKITWQKEHNDD